MEIKIKNNNEIIDATIEMVDGVMVVSPKEVKFEPKDGDVLSNYIRNQYQGTFILDNVSDCGEAIFHVCLDADGKFITGNGGNYCGYIDDCRPATEEEKKLLFDKLAEEGYEFDFEKKELVKLKWKPKEGETCFAPYFDFPKFITKQWLWEINGFSTDYYNKNWIFRTEQECQEFCDRLNEAINSVKP